MSTKKLTQEEFCRRITQMYGPEFITEDTKYVNSRTKVVLNCPKHGEFLKYPRNLFIGQGCIKCGKEDTKSFCKKASVKHKGVYDYSKVDYKTSSTKVVITCREHGEFLQTPNNHLCGSGCPVCGNIREPRETNEYKVHKATVLHGEGKYDYSAWNPRDVRTPSPVTCLTHNITWDISYDNHVNKGKGCIKCKGDRITKSLSMSLQDAQQILSEKHPHLTIDSTTYKMFSEKCTLFCDSHGEFTTSPQMAHTTKYGCPLCAEAEGSITGRALTQEEFIERAKVVLPHCDFSSTVYKNQASPVTFYCKVHKRPHTTRANHVTNKCKGCPECSYESVAKNLVGFINNTTVERNKEKYTTDSCSLYVVSLPDLGRDVYKIGIASTPSNRYSSLKRSFGKIEEVVLYSSNTYNSFHLEQFFHNLFSKLRYKDVPTTGKDGTRNQGWTEVFQLNNECLTFIKDFIQNDFKGDWYV